MSAACEENHRFTCGWAHECTNGTFVQAPGSKMDGSLVAMGRASGGAGEAAS